MSEFKNSERFLEILRALSHMKNGIITDQWVSEQIEQIHEYRQFCDDFSIIEADIEDSEFRTSATNVESFLRELCYDLCFSRPFRVDKYFQMMTNMEVMCRSFITDYEMLECMNKLGF